MHQPKNYDGKNKKKATSVQHCEMWSNNMRHAAAFYRNLLYSSPKNMHTHIRKEKAIIEKSEDFLENEGVRVLLSLDLIRW